MASLHRRLATLKLGTHAVSVTPDPLLVERRVIVALAHRAALEQALAAKTDRVLLLEDHCLLLDDLRELLPPVLAEWRRLDNGVLHLGAATFGRKLQQIDGYQLLEYGVFRCCFAVGYTRSALERLLAEMPADGVRMGDWIAARNSLDDYLASQPDRALVKTRLATIPSLLPYEDPMVRDRFLP